MASQLTVEYILAALSGVKDPRSARPRVARDGHDITIDAASLT